MASFEKSAVDRVVENDLCVGCGICKLFEPENIDIGLDDRGFIKMRKTKDFDTAHLTQICPMSGEGKNESELGAQLFPSLTEYDQIGRVLAVAAVHVENDDHRIASSSGGLLTWLACKLLENGEVDGIIHVGPGGEAGKPLYAYKISSSVEEVRSRTKSKYYPVELSEVLAEVEKSDKTYALMGLPCFLKGVRRAALQKPVLQQRIKYMFGLICGHLKSHNFAESLAWQAGADIDRLKAVDFRHKIAGREASSYGFTATHEAANGQDETLLKPMSEVTGGDWGQGFFKYKACEFCDDVIAECADIAVGDAWLPEYVKDYRGENIVCFRNERLFELVKQGVSRGELGWDILDIEQLMQSQSAGLRHRNEGLSHRLHQAIMAGEWVPKKRVTPAVLDNPRRARIYDLREVLRVESTRAYLTAKAQRSLTLFKSEIAPHIKRYRHAYRAPFTKRVIGKVKRMLAASG